MAILSACAGPGAKLDGLDRRIAENPNDVGALRDRIELLVGWRGGPDDRMERAARDAGWLGGRLLIPDYVGADRWFLTPETRGEVEDAVALLERALDWDESGEHRATTLGKLAQANHLLAEDTRNRQSPPLPNEYDRQALEWSRRLSEDFPTDPLGHYGRGIAYLRLGDAWQALEAFERCESLCQSRIDTQVESRFEEDLRFKSKLRRAEAFGRLEKTDESVALIREAFGEVAMESAFAVSAAYRTAGEAGQARAVLEGLLSDETWRLEPRLYLELACLAAIEGETDQVEDLMVRCLKESRFDLNSVEGSNLLAYSALWRWMLTGSEEARVELADIVENASIGNWERVLLAFCAWGSLSQSARDVARRTSPEATLEAGSEEWLLYLTRLELGDRSLTNQDPDDLHAEAWFYLGWRRKNQGRIDAREAFERALELADPNEPKWEFEFARHYLSQSR